MIVTTLGLAPLAATGWTLATLFGLFSVGKQVLDAKDQKAVRELTRRADFQNLLTGNLQIAQQEILGEQIEGQSQIESAVSSVAQDAPELGPLLAGKQQRLAQMAATGPKSLAEIIAGV